MADIFILFQQNPNERNQEKERKEREKEREKQRSKKCTYRILVLFLILSYVDDQHTVRRNRPDIRESIL